MLFRSGYRLHGLGVLPTICSHGGGLTANATDLIAALRSDAQPARTILDDWRATPPLGSEVIAELRQICPADNGAPIADVETAEMLIANPALYARVLESGTEAFARRP